MPGTVVIESFDSELLAGNALGDPTRRHFPVYLPPGYGSEERRRYPVLYVLPAFGSSALGAENASIWGWGERLSERLDRLIESGACPPVLAVCPECATRLGGSQYLTSSATGPYEAYLVEEVVAFIDQRYRTVAEPGGRGLLGRSSGGYGALVLAMRHPDVFGALAAHAADMGFAYAYWPDFPAVVGGLGEPPDPPGFIERFLAAPKKGRREFTVMNILAMAACYSPNPGSPWGFDLPFDLHTGELDGAVWARWLAHDPVELVARHAEALRVARLVYFDCGRRDDYNLHLGARRLHRRLEALGVAHEYAELDDDHHGLVYRYDESIPKLAQALGPEW
jgi:S-formylglutathione hydrolase FrmB